MNKFDAYEIGFCCEYANGVVERVDSLDDITTGEMEIGAVKKFWTVYGHIEGGGVQAISDCLTKDACYDLIEFITGQKINEREGDTVLYAVIPIEVELDNDELIDQAANMLDALNWIKEIVHEPKTDTEQHIFDIACDATGWSVKVEQPETYSCAAISTAHMTLTDSMALTRLVAQGDGMIMIRDTGFFIKLYEEPEYNRRDKLSAGLNDLIEHLHSQGFRLVEFDQDADKLDDWPTYVW